jgi:hypothetical protein
VSSLSQRPDPSFSTTEAKEVTEQQLVRQVIRLSSNVLGLTLGILGAAALFLATNILVLKGGPRIGPHLELLNQFLPGYRVTFAGGVLGAVYGFILGYISGWIIAAVYNRVVLLRQRDGG